MNEPTISGNEPIPPGAAAATAVDLGALSCCVLDDSGALCQTVEKAANIKDPDRAFVRLSAVKALLSRPQQHAQAALSDDLPPLPDLDTLADMERLFSTPADWDADYRNTWQKLQVAERNKMQWRVYALKLHAILAASRQPAAAPSAPIELERADFEDWYASHARDIKASPIGSYECALMWAAWVARAAGFYKARGDKEISPQPWGVDVAPAAPVADAAPQGEKGGAA